MGKASRWFRALLGLKNTTDSQPHKKKWSFTKSHQDKNRLGSPYCVITGGGNDDDDDAHARAVAAASAAVAEATVAAAQAASAVVQLTSSGRHIYLAASGRDLSANPNEVRAAVVIQSHFRAYLSRRALRALKGLVKLQALVRGHLVRKQTAYTLRRLQALVRAQARARAGRVLATGSSLSSRKLSHFNHSVPPTPEKLEHVNRTRSMKQDLLMMLKRNGSKLSRGVNYDRGPMDRRRGETWWEKRCSTGTDLPIDGHVSSNGRSHFDSSHLSLGPDQNFHLSFSTSKDSSREVQSFIPLMLDDDATFFYSASSGGGGMGSFTPARSDWSRSCVVSVNSDHPSYMDGTESSRAKTRSHSAPKQRPQMERSSSTKRCLFRAYGSQRGSGNVPNIY